LREGQSCRVHQHVLDVLVPLLEIGIHITLSAELFSALHWLPHRGCATFHPWSWWYSSRISIKEIQWLFPRQRHIAANSSASFKRLYPTLPDR
jgi:hypothetical protein